MYTSVKNFKDHLSAFLHRVYQGEEVIVTLHNKPVVKLVPIFEEKIQIVNKRKIFLDELEELHKKTTGISMKETMSETLLQMRKKERS